LAEVKAFFGDELNFADVGIDRDGKSHSQVLADRIKQGVDNPVAPVPVVKAKTTTQPPPLPTATPPTATPAVVAPTGTPANINAAIDSVITTGLDEGAARKAKKGGDPEKFRRILDPVKNGTVAVRTKAALNYLYQKIRTVASGEYDGYLVADADADSAGVSSAAITVAPQGGWFYRGPASLMSLKGWSGKKGNTKFSANVTMSAGLISDLDTFVSDLQKQGVDAYYKTPDSAAGWDSRHDPVSIYSSDTFTPAQTAALAAILSPHVRSNSASVNTLTGNKIADGIFEDANPSKQQLAEAIAKAKSVGGAEFGAAIESYLGNKASTGQLKAVNDLLNLASQTTTAAPVAATPPTVTPPKAAPPAAAPPVATPDPKTAVSIKDMIERFPDGFPSVAELEKMAKDLGIDPEVEVKRGSPEAVAKAKAAGESTADDFIQVRLMERIIEAERAGAVAKPTPAAPAASAPKAAAETEPLPSLETIQKDIKAWEERRGYAASGKKAENRPTMPASAATIGEGVMIQSDVYKSEGKITILGPAEIRGTQIVWPALFGNTQRSGYIQAKQISKIVSRRSSKVTPIVNPATETEPVFNDTYTGPRWTYGMRNRPLSMGAAPKGYIIGSIGGPAVGRARYGTIQYPRELTKEELYDFEMEAIAGSNPATDDSATPVTQLPETPVTKNTDAAIPAAAGQLETDGGKAAVKVRKWLNDQFKAGNKIGRYASALDNLNKKELDPDISNTLTKLFREVGIEDAPLSFEGKVYDDFWLDFSNAYNAPLTETIDKPAAKAQPKINEKPETPPETDGEDGQGQPPVLSGEQPVDQLLAAHAGIPSGLRAVDVEIQEKEDLDGPLQVAIVNGKPVIQYNPAILQLVKEKLDSESKDFSEWIKAAVIEEHAHVRFFIAVGAQWEAKGEAIFNALTPAQKKLLKDAYGEPGSSDFQHGGEYVRMLFMFRSGVPVAEIFSRPVEMEALYPVLEGPQSAVVEEILRQMQTIVGANPTNAEDATLLKVEKPEPKPEPTTKKRVIPRAPANVPDDEIEMAEQQPVIMGSGDGSVGVFTTKGVEPIPYTYALVDSRMVVDEPDNEREGPNHPNTLAFVFKNSGKAYDTRKSFVADPDFQKGPALVEPAQGRYVIQGGHRRTYIYRANREAYEAELANQLARYGIDPSMAEAMIESGGHPYLVAIAERPILDSERPTLIRALNNVDQQAVNPIFEAVSAGRNISEETVKTAGYLFNNTEGTPLAALQSAAGRDLAAAMLKDNAIRETDKEKYIDSETRSFTEEGAKFVRRALLGRVLDSPELLARIDGTPAQTKLLNALSVIYAMERRGQDMAVFAKMLVYESERLNGETIRGVQDYQQSILYGGLNFMEPVDERAAVLQRWFGSFNSRDARKHFNDAMSAYLPNEDKAQQDIFGQINTDLADGLIVKEKESGQRLYAGNPAKGELLGDAQPKAENAMKVWRKLNSKRGKGEKLTPNEEDQLLDAERELGQQFLIDPAQTPRLVLLPDPPRAKTSSQSRPSVNQEEMMMAGEERGGQRTLFAGNPAQAKRLAGLKLIEEKRELRSSEIKEKNELEKFTSEPLFAGKVKASEGPELPGFGGPAKTRGLVFSKVEGAKTDTQFTIAKFDGKHRFTIAMYDDQSGYGIERVQAGKPNVPLGNAKTLAEAQAFAERVFKQEQDAESNKPLRGPSTPLVGPRSQEGQGELYFPVGGLPGIAGTGQSGASSRGSQGNGNTIGVSLKLDRAGLTQTSPVDYLPARLSALSYPHQRAGANLNLHAFNGGNNFLNGDGAGAGKTGQQLLVAAARAEQGDITLIVTQSDRIIDNAFSKDGERLGMTKEDAPVRLFRYNGDEPKKNRIYMATYSDVTRGLVEIGAFETVIFDESQEIRNVKGEDGSARAQAGLQLARSAKHVALYSATPFDQPFQLLGIARILGQDPMEMAQRIGVVGRVVESKDGTVSTRYERSDEMTDHEQEAAINKAFNELTRQGKMIKRDVPMTNVSVEFKEVKITDAEYNEADAIYQQIVSEMEDKGAYMNAVGVASMTVRGYLENAKIKTVIKEIEDALADGRQAIVFADRVTSGKDDTYAEGIDGTLTVLHEMLEAKYGKGMVGRIFGGNATEAKKDIASFERGDIKIIIATPSSGGTGINLDDIYGDRPRTLIVMTAPMTALEIVQIVGRINRLTTKSKGRAVLLFAEHPVDTWSLDIAAEKMRTLFAAVSGDFAAVRPIKARTAELQMNDDVLMLAQDMGLSESDARKRLTSSNEEFRNEAIERVKELQELQIEAVTKSANKGAMSEKEIVRLADDPIAFSALSPGHALLQRALANYEQEGTLNDVQTTLIRAVFVPSKGEFLNLFTYQTNDKMSSLGRGGGSLGAPQITMKKGQAKRTSPDATSDAGKVFLHEFGHAGYFALLTAKERQLVNRVYAKLGGRSGAQDRFRTGHPQPSRSNFRYYSKNVYEFFAESFAQYVYEKKVPSGILQRLYDRIIAVMSKMVDMFRQRADLPTLKPIFDRILDLKKEGATIDYSFPDRSSLVTGANAKLTPGQRERYYRGLRLRAMAKVDRESETKPIRPDVLQSSGGPTLAAGNPAASNKEAKAAESELSLSTEATQDQFRKFLARAAQRTEDESVAAAILEEMEENDISPQSVTERFKESTYDNLPEPIQKRFQRMIKSVVGLQPGDAIYAKEEDDGSITAIEAKSWKDVIDVIDAGDEARYLQGTERGLIVMMHLANKGAGQMKQATGSKVEGMKTLNAGNPAQQRRTEDRISDYSDERLARQIPTNAVQREWIKRGVFPANLVYVPTPKEQRDIARLVRVIRNNSYNETGTKASNKVLYAVMDMPLDEKPFIKIGADIYEADGMMIAGNASKVKSFANLKEESADTPQMLAAGNPAASNKETKQSNKYVIGNLTAAEAGKLKPSTERKMVEIFNELPSTREMAAVALGGEAKRGWYKRSAEAILHVFQEDAPRFAALLAATSPQTSVETNLRNALNIWKNWTDAGRPTDRDSIVQIMSKSVGGSKGVDSILGAWIPNTVRALASEDPIGIMLSGPKVDSFMRNLLGNVQEVTNDAWMANYALVDQSIFSGSLSKTDAGKGAGYLAMSAKVRSAAKYLTKLTGEEWTPAEVQETIWSWAKTLYEARAAKGEIRTAQQILDQGGITKEMIAATPDFSTLFADSEYGKILKDAGYEKQLATLQLKTQAETNKNQSASAQAEASPKATSAFAVPEQQRAARRLEKLYQQRQAERQLVPKTSKQDASPQTPGAGNPANADDIERANKTARTSGAIGGKAITPRYVAETVKPGETVLNFGAGKPEKESGKYAHSELVKSKGAKVSEYDFGANSTGVLGKKYNTVFASNVLNVQSGEPMLRNTLEQIKGSVEENGRAVFNYPDSPRYSDITPDAMANVIGEVFGEQPVRVGGTKSAPLWSVGNTKTLGAGNPARPAQGSLPITSAPSQTTSSNIPPLPPGSFVQLPSQPTPPNTVPGRIDSIFRRILSGGRWFWEGTADVLERAGYAKLAKAIKYQFDVEAREFGEMWKPIRDVLEKHSTKIIDAAKKEFADYFQNRENGRDAYAATQLTSYSAAGQELIAAWKKVAVETGLRLTNLGVEVQNPDGSWRPIGNLGEKFFPRKINQATMKILEEPEKYPVEWKALVDALIANGNIATTAEAEEFLKKHVFYETSKSDYFATIEKARTGKLPESWLEYKFDEIAPWYVTHYARRSGQIEAYGQEHKGGDLFDKTLAAMPKRKPWSTTQAYVKAAKDAAYMRRDNTQLAQGLRNLQTLATGTFLTNPFSSIRNVVSGVTQSAVLFGPIDTLKASWKVLNAMRDKLNLANELGVLRDDMMQMMVETRLVDETTGAQALRKVANLGLTISGFNLAERFARMVALTVASDFARSYRTATGAKKDQMTAFLIRNDANPALIFAGDKKETNSFIRNSVAQGQGSYKFPQTPLYFAEPKVAFLMQFGKWGTQMTRTLTKHAINPAVFGTTVNGKQVRTFMPLLYAVAFAIGGGELLYLIRDLFTDRDRPDASIEEINKALTQNEQEGIQQIANRVFSDIIMAGTLGMFSDYAGNLREFATRNRFKNPFDPAGVQAFKNVFTVLATLKQQRTLTSKDIKDAFETQFSGAKFLDQTVRNITGDKKQEALQAQTEARQAGMRMAKELGMPVQSTFTSSMPVKSPKTPYYTALNDALLTGDVSAARKAVSEFSASLPPAERSKAVKSLGSSVNQKAPIKVGGIAGATQRADFMKWAGKRLPEAQFRRITELDATYWRTAIRAGVVDRVPQSTKSSFVVPLTSNPTGTSTFDNL
jgi:hypothetical protein